MFFVVCSALRLARFTADIYVNSKPIDKNIYFVGLPSPAAAVLSMLPLYIYFEYDFIFVQNAYFNLINLFFIGFLMVSKVPTISLKNINFSKKLAPWIVLLISVICIGLISNLWLTLIILATIYLCSIIYTILNNIFFFR